MPWHAGAGWLLLVLVVGLAYAKVMHAIPWFLVIVLVGRLLRALWLSRRVWIAMTADQLQVLDGSAEVWSIPRRDVAAIHIARDGASRVEFVDERGEPLLTAPLMYSARQIGGMAEVLATPVVDHRA